MCSVKNFVNKSSGLWLTPLFWDCKCEEDYIHPVSDATCWRCQMHREESPDARVSEVLKFSDILPKDLVDIVEKACETVVPDFALIPF